MIRVEAKLVQVFGSVGRAIGRQSFWGLGAYVKLPGRLTSHSSVDSCGSLVPDFADIRAAHVLFTPGAIKTCTWKTEYSLGHRNLRVRKRSQFSMDVQRNVVTSNLRPGRCFGVYFYSSYACISRAARPNLSWIHVMKTGQSMGFWKCSIGFWRHVHAWDLVAILVVEIWSLSFLCLFGPRPASKLVCLGT